MVPTGPVTAPTGAYSGPNARRSWARRVPWLWHDYVVSRTSLPLWSLALLIFLFLYIASITLAAMDGVLPQFLRDMRYLATSAIPAVTSIALGYAPRALDRFWQGLKPWLANPDDELLAFHAATRDQFARFFWPPVLLLFIFMAQWAFFPDAPGNWARDYPHVAALQAYPILVAPFMAYFVGGIFSMAGVGPSVFIHRMQAHLDLKRGFILQGGKAVLRPLNDLLRTTWTVFAIAVLLVVFTSTPLSGTAMSGLNFLSLAMALLLGVPVIIVPQVFMNRWLTQEKAQELHALHTELEEAAAPLETRDTFEVLRRMQRHQHLLHQVHRVEAFTPTIVDARFALQIATSFTAIVLANVLLRTALARFLQ